MSARGGFDTVGPSLWLFSRFPSEPRVFSRSPFTPRTKMLCLPFRKKPKKSRKHSQQGISASTAAGPLGSQAEPDTSPKGENNRAYQGLGVDSTDSTVAPDNSSSGSRIVVQGKTGGDHELPAPEISTPDAVVSDTDRRRGTSSKCFRSLSSQLTLMWISMPLHM